MGPQEEVINLCLESRGRLWTVGLVPQGGECVPRREGRKAGRPCGLEKRHSCPGASRLLIAPSVRLRRPRVAVVRVLSVAGARACALREGRSHAPSLPFCLRSFLTSTPRSEWPLSLLKGELKKPFDQRLRILFFIGPVTVSTQPRMCHPGWTPWVSRCRDSAGPELCTSGRSSPAL